ncbi:unnamed protein product [Ectocarpus sp. CCAP 1310/34]|nr:unnamed protein product [Ectocarpus sp. CCAP 1310/34]
MNTAPFIPPQLRHGESRRTAAPKGGTRGERAYRQLHARRTPFKDINTTASTCLESTRDTTDAAAATSGSSDAAAAADTSHESRGRTRERSLSWHCRQKLGGDLQQQQQPPATTPTYSSSAFCPSPSAFSSYNNTNMLIDNSGRINDGNCSCCTTPRQQYFCCESMLRSTSCGSSISSGNESAGEREGGTSREARGRRGRSAGEPGGKERGSGGAGCRESIDAEELFRRKNKMASFNVTYGRWAESYDRGMARRASLERRERLEIERENDLRRQRAEEEFQVRRLRLMLCLPFFRVSFRGDGGDTVAAAAAAATTPTATPALGARSSYHERASSASPRRRRRRLTQIRKEAWTDGERDKGVGGSGSTLRSPSSRHSPFAWSEESAPFSSAGGRGDEGGVGVGGSGSGRCGGDEEEEERKRRRGEEEQRRRRDKANRAFREWLGRKKGEAQADREVQRRKEENLEKIRVLEVSRRWKKRPVVCAYTYGAKVGAREWQDREEGVRTQAEGGEGQQPEEQEAGRVASMGEGMEKEREEEEEKEKERQIGVDL